jgi:hypothetical protein
MAAKTALEKISSGLGGSRRHPDGHEFSIAGRMGPDELSKAAMKLADTRAELKRFYDQAERDIAFAVERVRAFWNDPARVNRVDLRTRQTMAADEINQAVREIKETIRPLAEGTIAAAGRDFEPLADQRDNYPSKIQLLSEQGLGTPERARYEATCAKAGAMALRGLAQRAISRRDAVLAASVLAEAGNRPPADRRYLAALVHDIEIPEWTTADTAFHVANSRMNALAQEWNGFFSGRPVTAARIELALNMRDEEAAGWAVQPEGDDEPTG